MSLINSHVEKHWDDNLPPRSEPARLLSGIEEGKIEPSESVGLTLGGLIKIRKAFLQRARKARLDSAQGVAAKGVAFLALHAGNVIDELRFSAAAKRT